MADQSSDKYAQYLANEKYKKYQQMAGTGSADAPARASTPEDAPETWDGSSIETPVQTPILSHAQRIGQSFGDDQYPLDVAKNQGYEAPVLRDGRVLAKRDGKYYQDQGGKMPYLERHTGDAPGMALQTLGALAGGKDPKAVLALSGAGSATGELLKQIAGKYAFHTRKEMDPVEMGIQGALGVGAEGLGMGIKKGLGAAGGYLGEQFPPLQDAATSVKEGLKKALAYGSGKLGGQGTQASLNMLNNPEASLAGREGLDAKAEAAGNALLKKRQNDIAAHNAVKDSEAALRENNPLDTSGIIDPLENTLKRNQPNASGQGGIQEDERQQIQALIDSMKTKSGANPMLGLEGQDIPSQTYGNLSKAAEQLQQDAKFRKAGKLSTGSDKLDSTNSNALFNLKSLLHEESPALTSSDALSTKNIKEQGLLQNLTDPSKREAFITQLYKDKKTAVTDAAKNQLPEANWADIRNAATDHAFDNNSMITNPLTSRNTLSAALGAAAAGSAYNDHDNSHGLATGLLAVGSGATNPAAHRLMLGYGERAAGRIIPAATWSLLKDFRNKEKEQ